MPKKLIDDVKRFWEEFGGLKKNVENINEHLKVINGHVADYPKTKEKLDNACQDLDEIKPIVNKLQIKFYTIVVFTGLASSVIGSAITAAILRAFGG
jgi:uncharacterized coiled-coil DUF342 family protein